MAASNSFGAYVQLVRRARAAGDPRAVFRRLPAGAGTGSAAVVGFSCIGAGMGALLLARSTAARHRPPPPLPLLPHRRLHDGLRRPRRPPELLLASSNLDVLPARFRAPRPPSLATVGSRPHVAPHRCCGRRNCPRSRCPARAARGAAPRDEPEAAHRRDDGRAVGLAVVDAVAAVVERLHRDLVDAQLGNRRRAAGRDRRPARRSSAAPVCLEAAAEHGAQRDGRLATDSYVFAHAADKAGCFQPPRVGHAAA